MWGFFIHHCSIYKFMRRIRGLVDTHFGRLLLLLVVFAASRLVLYYNCDPTVHTAVYWILTMCSSLMLAYILFVLVFLCLIRPLNELKRMIDRNEKI
jgi:hypothetical protein